MDISQIKNLLKADVYHWNYQEVMYYYRKGVKGGHGDFFVFFEVGDKYYAQKFNKFGVPIGTPEIDQDYDWI